MKNTFLITSVIFAIIFGSIISTQAGHHGHTMFSANISDMDKNNDGAVTFEEYAQFHSDQLRWSFNTLDSDNDGSINDGEWDQFLKMHGVGQGYDHNQEG